MNVAAHNTVVCLVSVEDTDVGASGVSDGGSNVMTPLSFHLIRAIVSSQFWYISNAAANSAATWTATTGGTWGNGAAITCVQYSGVMQVAPVEIDDPTLTGSNNTGASTTSAITTSTSNSLVLVAQSCETMGTSTCVAAVTTSGYSIAVSSTNGTSNIAEKISTGVLSAESTSWTFTGTPWQTPAVVTFKPVGIVSVASASTVNLTGIQGIVHVTGTAAISNFTPDNALTIGTGGCLWVVPDGLWTTTSSGNIDSAATAVVGRTMTACYDKAAALWYLSY
jgi:hypothetical protein